MMTSRKVECLLFAALAACTSNAASQNDPLAGTDGGADGGAFATDAAPGKEEICSSQPCGGGLLGTWQFAQTCQPTRPDALDDCDANQTHFENELQGEVAFYENGLAAFNTRLLQFSYHWFPKRCFVSDSCENRLNATPPLVAECVDAGDYCDCRSWSEAPLEAEALEYQTSGNQLVIATPDGDVHFTYCVDGDALRYVHETGEVTVAKRPL